jgi:hypothetical protein
MTEIELDRTLMEKIRNGYQPSLQELDPAVSPEDIKHEHVKLTRHNHLVAIAEVNHTQVAGSHGLRIRRVFL